MSDELIKAQDTHDLTDEEICDELENQQFKYGEERINEDELEAELNDERIDDVQQGLRAVY